MISFRLKTMSLPCCALTALAAAMAAAPAWAQATAPAEAAAADEGEIIVTAERREGKLVSTPISITALDAQALESGGVTNVVEIARLVPGIRMDQLGTATQPTIRGISSATANVGTSSNVATYVDGFYLQGQNALAFDLPDVTGIQVLKGPQGTLFGRNATGGAILINTINPSHQTAGMATIGYGTYDETLVNGYFTTGLTETLAVSVTGSYRNTDGWTRNIVSGERDGVDHSYFIGGKLLWQPTDRISLLFQAKQSRINNPYGQVWRTVDDRSRALSIPGSIVTGEKFRNSNNVAPYNRTRNTVLGLTATVELDGVTLTSLTGYNRERNRQRIDLDGSNRAIIDLAFEQNTDTFTQEVTLASNGDGPFNWTVGGFYFHDNGLQPYQYANFQGNPDPVNNSRFGVRTRAIAGFADATWNVAGGLFLTGGLRYSSEKRSERYSLREGPEGRDSKRWSSATPRAAIRYEIDPRNNAYASYSKGFKSGAFNSSDPTSPPVNPEKVDAFEIGFKHAGRALSFELSAFYYDYKDIQVTSYTSSSGTSLATLQNAASARVLGAEAAVRVTPTTGLNLNLGLSYVHGEYKDFDAAVGLDLTGTGPGYPSIAYDASGNMMMRSPRWSGNAGFDYETPVSFGTIGLSGNVSFQSKYYDDAPNLFKIKPRALVDLGARWTLPNDKWTVSVAVKNVFDKYYINYWDPVGVALLVNDGRPRTARVTLSYKM